MKKLTKIASVLFAMLIAAACLPGCSNANQSKEESKVSSSSTSVASIAQEESKEESSESSVESSKETSKEAPKESSKTSSEETSKEESKESSIEQSEESSKKSSVESSVTSKVDEFSKPEIPVYQVESNKASFKNVTRYGKVLKTAQLKSKDTTARILKDYLVSILKVDDSTYDLYWGGYSITVDSSLIELFDEDYKPDFSLRYWQGIEDEYLDL